MPPASVPSVIPRKAVNEFSSGPRVLLASIRLAPKVGKAIPVAKPCTSRAAIKVVAELAVIKITSAIALIASASSISGRRPV